VSVLLHEEQRRASGNLIGLFDVMPHCAVRMVANQPALRNPTPAISRKRTLIGSNGLPRLRTSGRR
jgi:hypothetical protein